MLNKKLSRELISLRISTIPAFVKLQMGRQNPHAFLNIIVLNIHKLCFYFNLVFFVMPLSSLIAYVVCLKLFIKPISTTYLNKLIKTYKLHKITFCFTTDTYIKYLEQECFNRQLKTFSFLKCV